MRNIGDEIEKLRKEKGMTLEELGVSPLIFL